jgi:hypothetical protein
MVTRREVLKGTAAVSIGAIAAAHGAAPVEAASLDLGWGQLDGGAIGGFIKQPSAFQIAVKFDKWAAELFYKELPGEGVGAFFKFFSKHWVTDEVLLLPFNKFPDLEGVDFNFSKLDPVGVSFFLKKGPHWLSGEIGLEGDTAFYKPVFETHGD